MISSYVEISDYFLSLLATFWLLALVFNFSIPLRWHLPPSSLHLGFQSRPSFLSYYSLSLSVFPRRIAYAAPSVLEPLSPRRSCMAARARLRPSRNKDYPVRPPCFPITRPDATPSCFRGRVDVLGRGSYLRAVVFHPGCDPGAGEEGCVTSFYRKLILYPGPLFAPNLS